MVEVELTIQQKKLSTFRFIKCAGFYKIYYKSGRIEYLDNPDNSNDLKFVNEIYSPNGKKLSLRYDAQHRLVHIKNEHADLVSLVYNNNINTLATIWPDKPETYQLNFVFANNNLITLKNSALDDNLNWHFFYQRLDHFSNFYMIDGLKTPMGLTEKVIYKTLMQFPRKANLPNLPCVTQYRKIPGMSQPELISDYEYSDLNYLGFKSSVDWDPDRDNLYEILSAYQYHSIQTQQDDKDAQITTRRVYNNYHLLTEEVVTQRECNIKIETEYYAEKNKTFEEQPATCQLPKKTITTYTKSQENMEEIIETEFDNNGNLIKKKDNDGNVTQFTYYKKEGEPGCCPADPLGFCRFVKEKSLTPNTIEFPSPKQSNIYSYQNYSLETGNPISSMILLNNESARCDAIKCLDKDYTYKTDVPTDKFF
ncbi:hypothetical protein JZM24_09125 [Candidatus Sodalis endolongispinus]|uniref:Uncharacterized protein n=1 Tax=Candidatus Sodalis endolongispinus TaxID=2812662 RepID=A0ABS5YB45_9GAMM|nr:hypothetical protein [Candidatus Sodalis endolongispinus]MBT9432245.1 hypothetical protein [Candidatus Sodalis endolongispinus]